MNLPTKSGWYLCTYRYWPGDRTRQAHIYFGVERDPEWDKPNGKPIYPLTKEPNQWAVPMGKYIESWDEKSHSETFVPGCL